MKKVLLICYHFPPSAAIGGARPAHFAKYLPSFGWEPSVLTVDDRYIETFDPERLNDLKHVTVIKAGLLPTLRDLYLMLKRIWQRIGGADPEKTGEQRPPTEKNTPLRRLKRCFTALFVSLPDLEKGWILPAALRAVREIHRQRIDCILTSCPPYSGHLAGLLAKKLTGVPWVADFRDPWVTAGIRTPPVCDLSDRVAFWLEGLVIRNADLVLFNVDRPKDRYRQKYGSEPADKFLTLPNAIDRDVVSELRACRKYELFTLSYTGVLYLHRSPEPVFQAVSELIREKNVRPGEIRIKLVGACSDSKGRPVRSVIEAYGLGQVVEVIGTVPRLQALEIICRSHIALLFAPNQPYQLPGKIYDYIAAGAQILAIAEAGATCDFIDETGCGRSFRSDDIPAIKQFIHAALRGTLPPPADRADLIARFDAERLTGVLSENMNRIAGHA